MEEKTNNNPLPVMRLNPDVKDIFDFRYEDFTLEGYDPWPGIKAPWRYSRSGSERLAAL